MKKVLIVLIVSMLTKTLFAATEQTGSTHFQPKDLFEGDNRSELFLSVTGAAINTGSGSSEVNISGMYAYLIQENLQLGTQISVGTSSTPKGSTSNTDIYGIGIYNFNPELYNSYFGFLGVGVGTVFTKEGSESKFGSRLGAGKRFPIISKVQYVPMAWVEKVGAFDPTISLMPINFSLIF